MKKEKKHLVIVGFGSVASYKYSRSIKAAIDRGDLDSYSIVDLESQKETVLSRVQSLPAQPSELHFIPTPSGDGCWADISPFRAIRESLRGEYNGLKVLIATEPKAHEAYLRYCIENDIDSLVTKPIILPMRGDAFDPSSLESNMAELVGMAKTSDALHSVLCLGRYHSVYEDMIRQPIQQYMQKLEIPITSLHLKTSSGVWNLPDEFWSREDHPYKYGYGMLMHGAYHYVDIVCQFLKMNKQIYPNDQFTLDLTSYSAFPGDQSLRIPETLNRRLQGYNQKDSQADISGNTFGETDIVTVFCLRSVKTGQVLTLGSISLEQTTPGMRHWAPFPKVPYNINGRLHCTDLEAQLSTALSIGGRVVKYPVDDKAGSTDLRGRNFARVTKRSNALLLGENEFYSEQTLERPHGNSFSYSAETDVFNDWLIGNPTKSDLKSHMTTAAVAQKIAESIHNNGHSYKFDFPCANEDDEAAPYRPTIRNEEDGNVNPNLSNVRQLRM